MEDPSRNDAEDSEEMLRTLTLEVFCEEPRNFVEQHRFRRCVSQRFAVTIAFLCLGILGLSLTLRPEGQSSFHSRTASRIQNSDDVPDMTSLPYLDLAEKAKVHKTSAKAAAPKRSPAMNATKNTNTTKNTTTTTTTTEAPPPWNSSATVSTSPSLFCFALMIPTGGERGLLETAAQLKTSLFACDDHAIFSNVPGKVWGTPISVLWNVNLWCDKQPTPTWAGGAGAAGPWSAANTKVFTIVWDAVLNDPRWKKHDWIVKTDADTVFLPDSLRGALVHRPFVNSWYQPTGSYLSNCAMGLYGGLEVISRKAAYVMSERKKECPWVPQEDVWLRTCLQRLNVQTVPAYGAFCLRGCDMGMKNAMLARGAGAPEGMCPNQFIECIGPKAAFHAFKTPEAYRACYWKATSTAG